MCDESAESAVIGTKLYNLDDDVQVWSDYLRLHLHPKSVQIVEQYRHNSELDQFELYGQGVGVLSDHNTRSAMEDRLHFFLEECDSLQGLHILCNPYDGFGGMTSSVLEDLRDEYPGKGILVFMLHPPSFTSTSLQRQRSRLLNMMMCYSSAAEHCSAMLPLSLSDAVWGKSTQRQLPYLNYKAGLPYHSGAILASCLESLSCPYRLDTHPSLLTHLTDALTPAGRKILSLQAALPFPLQSGDTLADALIGLGDGLPWQPLTPCCNAKQKTDGQSVVLQGFNTSILKRKGEVQYPQALARCCTVEELLHMYLTEKCVTERNALCSLEQPSKVSAPYPHIFDPRVNRQGHLSSTTRPLNTGVESVPVLTSLQSSVGVGTLVSGLVTESRKLDLHRLHHSTEAGTEEDGVKDALDGLQAVVQAYGEDHDMD